MSEPKSKHPTQPAMPARPNPAPAPLPATSAPVAAIAAPASAPVPPRENPQVRPMVAASNTFAAFGATQAAFARSAEAVADEVAVFMRVGFANAADAATAILGAKTFSDAFAVNTNLAHRSFEAMLAGSTKLSEIGFRFATESLKPLMAARLG
jgi:hypothetical protein